MNKKIIAIIILMLFILPAIATAKTSSNKIKLIDTSNLDDNANLPVWETGDSWTYYCHFTSDDNDITYSNIEITVTSVTSSLYVASIASPVSGESTFYLGDKEVPISFEDATLTGELSFEKATLGLKSGVITMSGMASISGIPANFKLDLDLDVIPPFYPVSFPLDVGKSWKIPKSDITGKLDLKASILQLEDIFFGEVIGQYDVECTEFIEDFKVGGKTFDCYKITSENGGLTEIYYSEEAKNIVKAAGPEVELTLKTPGAPNKPKKPSGPTSGSSGTSYSYSTSTTDPEGDDVYYWFDWGDGKNSGWKGPYSSGQEITLSHTWSRSGTFKVKVKAKDTNDIESDWSDPLSVSMPRNRVKHIFLQKIGELLEKYYTIALNFKSSQIISVTKLSN